MIDAISDEAYASSHDSNPTSSARAWSHDSVPASNATSQDRLETQRKRDRQTDDDHTDSSTAVIRWRQYGKKPLASKTGMRGTEMVRMYFRCNVAGCPARKQIDKRPEQRDADGIAVYTNKHHIHDGKEVTPVNGTDSWSVMQPEAQQALQLSRVGQLFTGFLMLTPCGNIVFASPGFCRLTGYDPVDCLGQGLQLLEGNDTAAQSNMQLVEALQSNEEHEITLVHYKKHGAAFLDYMKITPVISDGVVVNRVIVHMDVTLYSTNVGKTPKHNQSPKRKKKKC